MDHRRLRQGAGTSAFTLAPSLQIPMHQRVSPSCLCCQAGRGRDAWSQSNPIPHANPGLSAQPSSSRHEGITKFYVWLTNSSLIQPWEGGKKLFLLNPLPARILHRASQIAPLAAQAAACRLGHFPSCLMLQVMGLLPARNFWENRNPTGLSLSARDQPSLQHWHLFSYSQKDLNIGEELMSLPDLPKISQFSMLVREWTGKQNDDTLTFARLEKTG